MGIRNFVLGFVLFLAQGNLGFTADSVPIYLDGEWQAGESNPAPPKIFQILPGFGPIDIRQRVQKFLQQNAIYFRSTPSTQWRSNEVIFGNTLTTLRLQKRWKGIEVLGAEAVVHLRDNQVVFASGDGTPLDFLPETPRISPEQAASIAYSSFTSPATVEKNELKVLVLGSGAEKKAHLAYQIAVKGNKTSSGEEYFVDAVDGRVLLVIPTLHPIKRKIFEGVGEDTDFQMNENLWNLLMSDDGCNPSSPLARLNDFPINAQAPFQDAAEKMTCKRTSNHILQSATFAWKHTETVFKYYQSVHNRNSLDGRGMPIHIVVNFGGRDFPNAAWFDDKSILVFGVGDPNTHNDFASSLDIVAHEFTHGITAKTAKLFFSGQSGALNESYSDIFGKLVGFHKQEKSNDWKLGKGLFKNPARYVRDLENPEISHTRNIKYKDQNCDRANDYCGVHVNSGIPNRAAVVLAQKIGLEALEKIYFLTLTQLLRPHSDFKEAKALTEAACHSLYGSKNAKCQAVKEAFESVGI